MNTLQKSWNRFTGNYLESEDERIKRVYNNFDEYSDLIKDYIRFWTQISECNGDKKKEAKTLDRMSKFGANMKLIVAHYKVEPWRTEYEIRTKLDMLHAFGEEEGPMLNEEVARLAANHPIFFSKAVNVDGGAIDSDEKLDLFAKAVRLSNVTNLALYNFKSTEQVEKFLKGMKSIKKLAISKTPMTRFPNLSDHKNLSTINFCNNKMPDVKINEKSTPPKLTDFILANNRTSSIEMENLKIANLDLSSNPIKHGAVNNVQILRHGKINLSKCSLTEISPWITSLKLPRYSNETDATINLNDNQITSVDPIVSLKGFSIMLKDNLISEPNVQVVLDAIKDPRRYIWLYNNNTTQESCDQIINNMGRITPRFGENMTVWSPTFVNTKPSTPLPNWLDTLNQMELYKNDKELQSIINAHANHDEIKRFITEARFALANPYLKKALEDMLKEIKGNPEKTPYAITAIMQDEYEQSAIPTLCSYCLHTYSQSGQKIPEDVKNNIALAYHIGRAFQQDQENINSSYYMHKTYPDYMDLDVQDVVPKNLDKAIAECTQDMISVVLSKDANLLSPTNKNSKRLPLVFGLPELANQAGATSKMFGVTDHEGNAISSVIEDFYRNITKEDICVSGNMPIADKIKIKRLIENAHLEIVERHALSLKVCSDVEKIYQKMTSAPKVWTDKGIPIESATPWDAANRKRLICANISEYREGEEEQFAKLIKAEYNKELATGINKIPTKSETERIADERKKIPHTIMQSACRLDLGLVGFKNTVQNMKQALQRAQRDIKVSYYDRREKEQARRQASSQATIPQSH